MLISVNWLLFCLGTVWTRTSKLCRKSQIIINAKYFVKYQLISSSSVGIITIRLFSIFLSESSKALNWEVIRFENILIFSRKNFILWSFFFLLSCVRIKHKQLFFLMFNIKHINEQKYIFFFFDWFKKHWSPSEVYRVKFNLKFK